MKLKYVWLDGCMKNELKRLLKSIHTAASGFITYNHTVMHSYAARVEIGNINRLNYNLLI